ncbi:hypothetical protein D9X30_4639 (plasmid) [Cupriavidus sp. U2]|nr:hypothetical protein D9X30_4639 [Cupriavidus sp. U2]
MLKKLILITAMLLPTFSFGESTPAKDNAPIWANKPSQLLAQNCRPEGAVPNGSYRNSCRNCKVQGCKWLVCVCDGKETSLDLDNCPQNVACNNKGSLQCGEC